MPHVFWDHVTSPGKWEWLPWWCFSKTACLFSPSLIHTLKSIEADHLQCTACSETWMKASLTPQLLYSYAYKTSTTCMMPRSAASLSNSWAPLDHSCRSLCVIGWKNSRKFFCSWILLSWVPWGSLFTWKVYSFALLRTSRNSFLVSPQQARLPEFFFSVKLYSFAPLSAKETLLPSLVMLARHPSYFPNADHLVYF